MAGQLDRLAWSCLPMASGGGIMPWRRAKVMCSLASCITFSALLWCMPDVLYKAEVGRCNLRDLQ